MKNQQRILITIILFLTGISFILCAQDKPYVVLLSLDGFRWDYINKVPTPNIDSIILHGVKAESLKPGFPTKTFPNHYSIVTGLYPDFHGIVANGFYDPETNREYRISNREAVEDGYFYGGEPIWVTAEIQGVTSASYFWVGSEAEIQGTRPTYWKKYDHNFPFIQRIDTVIYWLQLPEEKRPHLVLWYLDEPDGTGHYSGPETDNLKKQIVYLDSLIGVFTHKISELPIAERINFIIVSDHGMTSLSDEKVVYLSDYLNESWFERIEGWNPVFFFQPRPQYETESFEALKDIEHVCLWAKEELPEKWYYGSNSRILRWVMVADNGWQIKLNKDSRLSKGDHGYDNDFKDMHGIFFAVGPAFKDNYTQPTFENIQIYNLLCYLLNLTPAPNNGNFEEIKSMLIE
ncbi:MAG: alkaline phosphatase family protein [Bacteroidales bacterium]|nr:alkaline phosphatase family protein [Bacteroidales bacterium]